MGDQPNILLIVTDQQRRDTLSYASRSAVATPNIDELARQGVIFETAYSGATSCVPARASLLTGLLHHRVPKVAYNARAVTPQGLALKEGYWTIAHEMRAAGYETALLGKMHFQPIRADHGFETMRLCEHLPAGYEEGTTDDYREWLNGTGRKDTRFNKPGQPKTFPYEAYYHPTNWITRQALDFLDTRERSRPYFAVVSFTAPHAPYNPPEPYASMFPPEDVVLPDDGIEVNEHLPWPFSDAIFNTRPDGILAPKRVDQVGDGFARSVLAAMRALIKQVDDMVGELLAQVDLTKTAVFFLSDHGDYGGHRGFLAKMPWTPFDDLVRVPLVAAGPGIEGGRRIAEPVQSFDYLPTALELAGLEPPIPDLDCRSLVPVLRGEDADPERPIFASMNEGWPMVRRGRYKGIMHIHSCVHLLYDMHADPGETNNLSRDPAYAPLLAENRELIRRKLAEPTPDLWLSSHERTG